MARPDTTAWLESLADDYEIGDDFASSNFFKTQLLPTLQSEMLAINDQITQLVNQAPDTMDEPPAVNRLLNIQNDANAYGRLLTLLQDTPTSWDDLRQAFAAVTLMGWGKGEDGKGKNFTSKPVSYTHLRAHETDSYLVCRLLLEKKKAVCISQI